MTALAEVLSVAIGIRPLVGHCGRWPAALSQEAMRRSPAVHLPEAVNDRLSLRLQQDPPINGQSSVGEADIQRAN